MISKQILDEQLTRFDKDKFLEVDPLGIVYELMQHTTNQLDIELGALFVAMLSWGNRKAIRKAACHLLCDVMEWKPVDYIIYKKYRKHSSNSCALYRTLSWADFAHVCEGMYGTVGLCIKYEETLEWYYEGDNTDEIIDDIAYMLSKANCGTYGKSACKRINMWLRWMIRRNAPDLGLWKSRNPSELYAIMDTHVMQLTAPLLQQKTASWKSMQKLTTIFRQWDPNDPTKYDIALMCYADSLSHPPVPRCD